MITVQQIKEYLSEHISDPVPKYIMQREIYKKTATSSSYINTYNQMKKAKWYCELANEQRDDGSWGRFHTQDTKAADKKKFVTTEAALRRARELSLSKDDPIVARCIKLMERYVRDEETWTDNIEKQRDDGKSHLYSRPFLTASNINLFDTENPVVKPKRDVFVKTLRIALSKGYFDEVAWEEENRNYRGPCLNGWNAYPFMILQNAECMDDTLQRQYLDYIWNRKDGIYYISNFPPAQKRCLEDKDFFIWISILELLSGFSLFPEFMKDGVLRHLLNEVDRLIHENSRVVPLFNNIRYAESWRDKNTRKTDTVLRIARIIIKC